MHDLINNVEIGPAHVPLALLGEFHKDVAEFLRGASRDVDLAQVQVSIESGSLALAVSGLLAATTLWVDLAHLTSPNALTLIDPKRANVLERWQAAARENPNRGYTVADKSGLVFLRVDAHTSLNKIDDVWVQVEKYLHGKIVDIGGKTKANVHLELENGQTLTVGSSHELLAQGERNRLYRPALLHVTAEENLHTGELRALRLLAFETHQPSYDDDEFRRLVERGTKAWEDVANAREWIDALRGGQA
jgi:predicted Zn-dependent protease with MMP-like domain